LFFFSNLVSIVKSAYVLDKLTACQLLSANHSVFAVYRPYIWAPFTFLNKRQSPFRDMKELYMYLQTCGSCGCPSPRRT